jgi:hypothetical protein
MIPMMEGDILKYMPTATVGKVTDVRERDGKVWVKLDFTNLYYDATYLVPADESEYKSVSFKEREGNSPDHKIAGKSVRELHDMEEKADIGDFTPTGGG